MLAQKPLIPAPRPRAAPASNPAPAPGAATRDGETHAAGADGAATFAHAASNAPPVVPTRPLAEAIAVQKGTTCLDADMLIRRVARWLRRDAIDASVRVEVQGSLTRTNAASFVIVRSDGRRAERRFEQGPTDCDQFHSAFALSIALAIDATLSGEDDGAPNSDAMPNDEDLLGPTEPSAPPYFRLALGVFGHATAGLLTSVSGALSGRIEVGFLPWLDLRAGAVVTQLDNQTFARAPGSFSMNLVAAQLEACGAHAVAGHLRMAVCAGGMAGALRTAGHDAPELSGLSDSKPWIAIAGSVEAQAEVLSWLAIAASVDLVVPMAKQRIVVDDPATGQAAGERELTAIAVLIGAGPIFRIF